MTRDAIKWAILEIKPDIEWLVEIAIESIDAAGDTLARRRVETLAKEFKPLARYVGCTQIHVPKLKAPCRSQP